MKDLIERLEKAEAGDHKLNAEICWTLERERAVSGWWRGAMGQPRPLPDDFDSLPRGMGMASLEVCAPTYTTSIDAALSLAERLDLDISDILNEALEGSDGIWSRGYRNDKPMVPQIALSVCIAILRAKEQQ